MDDGHAILIRLFRHNLWANDEMLRACAALTAEQLAHDPGGTYGRLDATLVHIARAQGGYARRLTGWQPRPKDMLDEEAPFPGIGRISEHLRMTGDMLLGPAGELAADRVLEIDYGGELQRIPAWVVLLQAAHHATEHRQQVATTLTHLGIEPPEPDLWAFALTLDGER